MSRSFQPSNSARKSVFLRHPPFLPYGSCRNHPRWASFCRRWTSPFVSNISSTIARFRVSGLRFVGDKLYDIAGLGRGYFCWSVRTFNLQLHFIRPCTCGPQRTALQFFPTNHLLAIKPLEPICVEYPKHCWVEYFFPTYHPTHLKNTIQSHYESDPFHNMSSYSSRSLLLNGFPHSLIRFQSIQ